MPSSPQLILDKKIAPDVTGLRVFDTWESASSLREPWNRLVGASRSCTIFLTWEWLRAWARTHSATTLHLLACFEGQELVGALPLYVTTYSRARLQGRLLRVIGDGSGDSDNLDLLAQPGYEQKVAQTVVRSLEAARDRWDILQLSRVPAESVLLEQLQQAMTAHGWRMETVREPRQVVRLPETWERYYAALPAGVRERIGRGGRGLQKRSTISFRRCEHPRELSWFLEELFRLHTLRWEQKHDPGAFSDFRRRDFYYQVAAEMLESRRLELSLLLADGRALAAEFGLLYGNTYSMLQSGFDPGCARHSPGVVLRAWILERLIRQGVRNYDFLCNDAEYMQRWRAEWLEYCTIRCARPGSRGAMWLELGPLAVRSKEWMRRHLPHSLFAALRHAYRAGVMPRTH